MRVVQNFLKQCRSGVWIYKTVSGVMSTLFFQIIFIIFLTIYAFFFLRFTYITAIPCTCRSSMDTIKDLCCPGPWTERCHRRCVSCTRNCRRTGSAWEPWKLCSNCGPTRRSWPVCCWYPSLSVCCPRSRRATTACPSYGCRPCNVWIKWAYTYNMLYVLLLLVFRRYFTRWNGFPSK